MKAFTLIELLVVIAIIAVLLTLLMPSLSASKKKAASAVCMSNLSQIYSGFVVYSRDYNGYFPPSSADLGAGGAAAVCSVNAGNGKLKWRAHGFLYGMGLLKSPQLFYCPLWEHPFWQHNKLDPADNKQAGIQDDLSVDVKYYKTSYIFRSWLANGQSPAPMFGEGDDPIMADFWTKDVWQYSHEGKEYNVTYLDGSVRHIDDLGQAIGPNAPRRTQHNELKTKWDLFFK